MTDKRFTAAQWFITNVGEHPNRLVIVSVVILAFGFLCELIFGSETEAFSRSGSLLVAFAIVVVFFNHTTRIMKSNTEKSSEQLAWILKPRPIVRAQVEAQTRKHIDGPLLDANLARDPDFFDTSTDSLIAKGNDIKANNDREIERLNSVEANLGYTEAAAGVLGTLVWGFGDIPFKFLTCMT